MTTHHYDGTGHDAEMAAREDDPAPVEHAPTCGSLPRNQPGYLTDLLAPCTCGARDNEVPS